MSFAMDLFHGILKKHGVCLSSVQPLGTYYLYIIPRRLKHVILVSVIFYLSDFLMPPLMRTKLLLTVVAVIKQSLFGCLIDYGEIIHSCYKACA